jgi:hypothetical protein
VNPDAGPTPPDSGTPTDAGRDFGTDSTKFFGLSRCNDAGVQLCDGFESGEIDSTTWTVLGTTPTIDATHVARGTHALHITRALQGESFLQETKTFPAINNTYWGRMFLYFVSYPSTDFMTNAHWTIVGANGTGTTGQIRVSSQLLTLYGKPKSDYFGVGTDDEDDGGTGDWNTSDNDPTGNANPIPLNQWICLEWKHDGQNNETSFYWDAVHHPSLDTTATHHGGNTNPYILPNFTKLVVGYQGYAPSDGGVVDMWLDEVAIDSERIGCVL